MLAQVAIGDATIYYDKLYTYAVPSPLQGHIFVGSMVLVPFGRGAAKPRMGVVLELAESESRASGVKEILDAAPEETRLTAELLAIVKYLKEATFCTWYEGVRAIIPYGAQYRPRKTELGWKLEGRLSRYTQTVYSPAGEENHLRKPTAKHLAVLAWLQKSGEGTAGEIGDACGATPAVLKTMLKNGLLQAVSRDKPALVGGLGAAGQKPLPALTQPQENVVKRLFKKLEEDKPCPCLLHGVTGSGKTLVFLHLVHKVLQAGKTALVLVPEIGLTPQMLGQMRDSFGASVAVQHSGLSNTERLLQWRQIQRGEARVVVGTRSGVFAPLENMGVIIVDEEQEHTYQSESSPRYDALEVVRRRAAYHGALLVLASATPSVVDYYAAQTGRYELLTLNERYGHLPLPAVELADMRGGAEDGKVIGTRLREEMERNLEQGEQTILLMNRRGYRTVGMCRDCGAVLKCGDCSVPMVYHKAGGRLLCHYCGRTVHPVPQTCPECEGELRYTGFGTQHVEEELQQVLPQARVLRMDLDSTARKGTHEEMLNHFDKGDYDILLGTQMVAKGLDFERVSLVGVIGIDSLLFSQGYKAYENVFSLLTQVVGRSGRANRPGRALIQTLDVNNPVLNLAASQDYEAFYKQEIEFRLLALYPPFCALCTVGFVAAEEKDALNAASAFGKILAELAKRQPKLPLRILGPAPMHVVQVAGTYRYRLTLKCRPDAGLRALLKGALAEYQKNGWPRKAGTYLDFHTDGAG